MLSSGHIPHESGYPYINDPAGVMKNIQNDKFSLQHLAKNFDGYSHLLHEMISPHPHLRPDIDTCILKLNGKYYMDYSTVKPISCQQCSISQSVMEIFLGFFNFLRV